MTLRPPSKSLYVMRTVYVTRLTWFWFSFFPCGIRKSWGSVCGKSIIWCSCFWAHLLVDMKPARGPEHRIFSANGDCWATIFTTTRVGPALRVHLYISLGSNGQECTPYILWLAFVCYMQKALWAQKALFFFFPSFVPIGSLFIWKTSSGPQPLVTSRFYSTSSIARWSTDSAISTHY